MYVRFQFAADVFAEQVRDKLARSDVGCIAPTKAGILVTRIAFPHAGPLPMDVGPPDPVQVRVAGGAPVSAPRNKLLLTLPIELEVRSVTGAAPGAPLTFTINAQLSVDLVRTSKGDGIQVAYHGLVHHEGTDPNIEKLVAAELSGAIAPRPPVLFDYTAKVFDALNSLTGGGTAAPPPPTVSWSGMTLSPDRQTVEFRLELTFANVAGTTVPWEWLAFHRREIDDLRRGRAWAVAIPHEALDAAVKASAHSEITSQGDISLESGPDVAWHPEFPGFRITFSGELLDACTCIFDDPFDDDFEVDLDIDVTLDMSVSLSATGSQATVRVDSRSSVDASDLESACCAITAAALWGAIGWKYLADGNVDGWGMVLGLAGGPIGAVLTMACLFDARPNSHAKDKCVTDGDDDNHQICSYVLNLNPPANACDQVASDIWLEDVFGRPDALVLSGSLHQRQLQAPRVTANAPTPFAWVPPPFRCSGDQPKWSAHSTFQVSQDGGEYPLIVGGAVPVGPAHAIYLPSVVGGSKCPTKADIDVATVPWTIGNPKPNLIAVLTNVGAHLVSVPALPALDPKRVKERDNEYGFWKVNNCYIFQDDWWGRGLNPHWLPDPPPDAYLSHHLWVLEYAGLQPGETLVVHDGGPDGEILATGMGGRGKTGTLTLLHDGDELTIDRDRSRTVGGRSAERYGIVISQLQLQQVDERTLDAPVGGLRSVGTLQRPAVELGDVGSAGLFGIDSAGYLLSADEPAGRLSVGVFDGAAGAGRMLGRVVEPADGTERAELVRVAASSSSELGLRSGLAAGAGVRATQRPQRWLVEAGADGFVEIDARTGRATAAYRDRPWTDGMVRVGRTFVRLDDDGLTVRTYRVGASVRL